MPFRDVRNGISLFTVLFLIAKYDVYDAKVWHLQVLSDILMDSGQ